MSSQSLAGRRLVSARRPELPEPLRGPEFGSYRPDEVGWLLTDISAADLERPTEEREEAIQAGTAHYAESLPIEYQPSEHYRAVFAQSLAATAQRTAFAVGVLTEQILAERGPDAVLASLARAGTPIGILVRRWARFAHDIDLPHYSVSIVRGRGIDTLALGYLATHHDASRVVFLDGWTGKGAIARELAAAMPAVNERFGADFSDELAVLADSGACVSMFGTREDILIASACLNSTVSGLVSRTVLNRALLGDDSYHGAKFYDSLVGADVSATFLDAVSAEFGAVRDEVDRSWPQVQRADRRPLWSGWAAVQSVADRYGIDDINLIKPGIGETTRVLLRRVPWRVLVRPDTDGRLEHVLLLAEQRGVELVEVPDLAFSCIGVIRPGDVGS